MRSGDEGKEPDGAKRGERSRDREGAKPEENVVRFPRDWIGPREELVPFGPSAHRDQQADEPDAAEPDRPISAEDFWGEHSAALHDTLEHDIEGRVSRAGHGMSIARLRRPLGIAGLAAAEALVGVVCLALFSQAGTHPRSRVASRVNFGHRRAISPWALPRHPSFRRPVLRSVHPRYATGLAHRSSRVAPVPATYIAPATSTVTTLQATSAPRSGTNASPAGTAAASGSGGVSSGTIASVPTGTSTATAPKTSSSTTTSSSSVRPKSATPAFGAYGALGPGSSPDG